MPSPWLPGYMWDPRMRGGRYRHLLPDGRLGRMVAARDLVADLRRMHDASADLFARLAVEAVQGRITPAVFQQALMDELRNLYNATSALAVGGWRNMTPTIWGRNGHILRDEYQYLANFAQAIANGELTEAEAAARARLYVGKAYSRYWDEEMRRLQASGIFTEYRWRTVKDAEVCTGVMGPFGATRLGCQELELRDWQPIGSFGTVPGAGATACLGNCRCWLEYR